MLVGVAARTSAPTPQRPAVTGSMPARPPTAVLRDKVAQFASAILTANVSTLPPSERKALDLVIDAARQLDPIFDRQAWASNPAHRAKLAADGSELGRLKLAYFDIMRGPWDHQDHFAPFAIDRPHPKGAGFFLSGGSDEGLRLRRTSRPTRNREPTSRACSLSSVETELSHSIGPAFVNNDGKTEIRMALGADYSPLEEGKAEVTGAYNILYLIDRGEFPATFRPQLLVSYFAGLFGSVPFGVAEAHGKGAAFQLNRFFEEGAAPVGPDGKLTIDLKLLEQSITDLTRDLCLLQHRGDATAVREFLTKHGVMSPPMAAALARLDGIPVDI